MVMSCLLMHGLVVLQTNEGANGGVKGMKLAVDSITCFVGQRWTITTMSTNLPRIGAENLILA